MMCKHLRIVITFFLVFFLDISAYNSLFCQSLNYNELIEKAEHFNNVNADSVNYYAHLFSLVAESNANPDQRVSALFLLVKSYIKTGDLVKALNFCSEANKLINNEGLDQRKAEGLIYFGNVYQSMGLIEEALNYFFESNKILGLNSSSPMSGDLYYYIACSYDEIGEIENSKKFLRLSIKTAKVNNLESDLFTSYLLLSNSFSSLDSISNFLDLSKQIIDKFPTMIFEKVVLLNNQAIFNKAIGNLLLSKAQYLMAIDIAEDQNYQNYLSTLYNNYGYQLMAENNYDSVRIVLGKALKIAQNINDIDLQATVYDSYSDYFSAIGNYKTGFAYQDSSIEKRNEYRNQQRIQETLFLSAVFETEQKDNELLAKESQISRLWVFILSTLAFLVAAIGLGFYFRQKFLLSKSNMEIMKKGKALELADALIHGQDAERKRLAMDLHDGLGARLGALRFLVDGFFSDHIKYHEVNNSIVTISQNVREISHRMLPAHLEEQGLVLTIQNSSINKSGKFEVVFESNLVHRLSEKLELNIYYLIYELINNAIKHSGGNTVFVQLIELDDCINLSVEDNGGGFNSQKRSEGLGLKNIKTRIEYLGGKFEINADDIVTLFLIEIPATKS